MGWTGYPVAPRDPAAEIERLCTFETDARRSAPVMTRRSGSTFYVAVRAEPKTPDAVPAGYQTDESGAYVFAAVFETRRERGEWLYKDMDETMGPTLWGAPLALIDALSPTTDPSALAWRQKCRDYAALARRRLSDGDVIRFAEPVRFADRDRQTFRVVRERWPGALRAVTRFECVETGATCRIGGYTGRVWDRIERVGEGGA